MLGIPEFKAGSALAILACGILLPFSAMAGAWPLAPGQSLIIAKLAHTSAREGFDPLGQPAAIPEREDTSSELYVEYGLTRHWTLQGKRGWTKGGDAFARYEGQGPFELGLRYNLWRSQRTAVSLYAGIGQGGVGRNAGYAPSGRRGRDYEVRLLIGRSGQWRGRSLFGEIQLARINRADLARETRLDGTIGVNVSPHWQVLSQVYAGQADTNGVTPKWLKEELSLVRIRGPWRLQVGWRWLAAVQEVAREQGPIVAIWRSF